MTQKLKKKNVKPTWEIIFKKIINPKKKNKEYQNEIPKIITKYLLFKAKTELSFLYKEAKKYKASPQTYIEAYISKMNELYHKDDKEVILQKQRERKENESKQLNNRDILKQIREIKESTNVKMDENEQKNHYNKYKYVKSRYMGKFSKETHCHTTIPNQKPKAKTPKSVTGTKVISFTMTYTEPRIKNTEASSKTNVPCTNPGNIKRNCTQKNLVRKYVLNEDESHEEIDNFKESRFFTEINAQEEENKCNSYRNTTNNQLSKKKKINQFVSFLNKNDLYYA